MLVGCMSVCFSASAAGDTLTIYGFYVQKYNGKMGFLCDPYDAYFIKNRGTSGETNVTDQFKDTNDTYWFSDDISVEYYYGDSGNFNSVPLSSFAEYDDFYYLPENATGFIFVIKNASSYSSVELVISSLNFGTQTYVPLTKNARGYWVNYPRIVSADFDVKPVDRLDITFSANPVPGANIGSDYSIDMKATAATQAKFADLELYNAAYNARSDVVEAMGVAPDYASNEGWVFRFSGVAITDGWTIVYPKPYQLNFAPPKKVSSPVLHDENANGISETYEVGTYYCYYATVGLRPGYKFTDDTAIYLNGKFLTTGFRAEYKEERLLVVNVDNKYATTKVNTVNIDFSADPKEGKPVGSDYDVTITPDLDVTLGMGRPLINLPEAPAGSYGTHDYNSSFVAIYESDNLLYPGYTWRNWNFAPQKAPANGSDPTGELGNRGEYSAGNYELGKTYKYYAIISLNSTTYAFNENAVFYVNGVKATDVTLVGDGLFAQVLLGEKTAAHDLTEVPAVTATTEQEGNVHYFHCGACGKNFSDAAGTQQLDKVTIDKLTPENPTNPENPQGGEDQKPAKTGSCKYCGEDHTGFGGFFVKIIHMILALFGLRK